MEAIINTNTLGGVSFHIRADGMEWARIRLRTRPEHQVLASSDYWEFDGRTYGPGEFCVAYHNTRVEHLVHPATAWTGETIGNGILIDQRLCFGICAHGPHSGVNVYKDGGLETFSASNPGWVQLEVDCCCTTKLKGGRINRYCVKGPRLQTCKKAVIRALWVPIEELPVLLRLS